MGLKKLILALSALVACLTPARAEDPPSAKVLFASVSTPSAGPARAIGFYADGCLSGAQALPIDGETWQAMRLSRNRRFGTPQLIDTIEKLSRDAAQYDGWPGLLVGDMSEPRGGPMISGHASHQIGLDVDIWLTPMPDHRLSLREREDLSAQSVLKNDGTLFIDPKKFTPAGEKLVMRAASYPEVQRIFVHPGIKKDLCDNWKGDRSNLAKVRPYWGHDDHIHIRLFCPKGQKDCKAQNAVDMKDDGCGENLAWWLSDEPWKPAEPVKPVKPAKPSKKPSRPSYKILSDLPKACATVLSAAAPSPLPAAALTPPIPLPPLAPWPEVGPVPTPRPAG
ncbi:penicillin-insensitive murein endopeptidase [Martelella alba]|uniref:Penicillin-insensitive murein endopeptidase n=1 Tax=Martelella alba TaxID=2590451 RepID=A0A506UEC6_9HYPH|nr:penicillin-insensitive murein endopeptidase [Martelella alba]TPW32330.1 penicillin-insensitive murein endopeptidase [Martelella alba]